MTGPQYVEHVRLCRGFLTKQTAQNMATRIVELEATLLSRDIEIQRLKNEME